MVTAATTEVAEVILSDFMEKLDERFGFRFGKTKHRRIYQSNVVIKFNKGVEDKIDAIKTIEDILNQSINTVYIVLLGYGRITL